MPMARLLSISPLLVAHPDGLLLQAAQTRAAVRSPISGDDLLVLGHGRPHFLGFLNLVVLGRLNPVVLVPAGTAGPASAPSGGFLSVERRAVLS